MPTISGSGPLPITNKLMAGPMLEVEKMMMVMGVTMAVVAHLLILSSIIALTNWQANCILGRVSWPFLPRFAVNWERGWVDDDGKGRLTKLMIIWAFSGHSLIRIIAIRCKPGLSSRERYLKLGFHCAHCSSRPRKKPWVMTCVQCVLWNLPITPLFLVLQSILHKSKWQFVQWQDNWYFFVQCKLQIRTF